MKMWHLNDDLRMNRIIELIKFAPTIEQERWIRKVMQWICTQSHYGCITPPVSHVACLSVCLSGLRWWQGGRDRQIGKQKIMNWAVRCGVCALLMKEQLMQLISDIHPTEQFNNIVNEQMSSGGQDERRTATRPLDYY